MHVPWTKSSSKVKDSALVTWRKHLSHLSIVSLETLPHPQHPFSLCLPSIISRVKYPVIEFSHLGFVAEIKVSLVHIHVLYTWAFIEIVTPFPTKLTASGFGPP